MRPVALVVSAALLSSCIVKQPQSGSATKASTIPPEEQLVSKVEHLSSTLSGKSCDDYGDTMSAWIESEGPEVERLASDSRNDPSLPAERLKVLEERLVSALSSIMAGHDSCRDNPRASDAYDSLATLVHK